MSAPAVWPGKGALLCLLLSACGRGSGDDAPPPTLEEVSEKVVFGSVASLGPHRLEADVVRRIFEPSGGVTERDEHVVMAWQDWDNFMLRRLQDGQVVSASLVVKGNLWVRGPKGRMRQADDPEPHRAELRLVWNLWDEALEPFRDRIELTEQESGVIEGRPARSFAVSLKALEIPVPKAQVEPLELSGTVWLDQATAVRLLAEVRGAWRNLGGDDRRREVGLYLVRSRIGEDQGLKAPGGRAREARRARKKDK